MRRLHIVETPEHRMGGEIYYRKDKYAHDPELMEAYECGKHDGWKCAMEEIERGGYGERHHYSHGSMPPMYRDEHPMHHDPYVVGDVDYRRHRNSMGRFSRY